MQPMNDLHIRVGGEFFLCSPFQK